jgi:protein-L-isoaspartate(D-aspartate) O-methyltransferase
MARTPRQLERLEAVRLAFAERITGRVRPPDARLVAAFARVPRERFVGPGPWLVRVGEGYIRTPDADPAHIYDDVLVALDPVRRLNNGQPSLHAAAMAALGLGSGDIVVHVGCGTGYYTAILAELVGAGGQVHGYEIDAGLAALAARHLADRSNVTIHDPAECEEPLPDAEAIYVSAGAGGPLAAWLAALREHGRLMFPLTGDDGTGVMLLVERRAMTDAFAARCLGSVQFIPLVGGRDNFASPHIAAAAEEGRLRRVRSLCLGPHADPATCILRGEGWWLSSRSLK